MNSTISEPLKISGELSQVIGDQSVETRLVLRTEDKLALPFWSNYDIGYVKVCQMLVVLAITMISDM